MTAHSVLAPKDLIVLVDTREQKPLLFPSHLCTLLPGPDPCSIRTTTLRVHPLVQKLEVGDYALSQCPTGTVVERKGSLTEVAKNCLDPTDRKRFERSLARLSAACSDPWVILEGSPHALLNSTSPYLRVGSVPGGVIVDSLLRLLSAYGVQLLMLPSNSEAHRRGAGEWILRHMLARMLCPPPKVAPLPAPGLPDLRDPVPLDA